MELYFLDDGSLIIDTAKSTKLIPADQFEIVRTTGCHYLSHLSGKEVYDSMVAEHSPQHSPLVKNEHSNSHKPMGTGNKKTE